MPGPRKILLTTDLSQEALRAFGPVGRLAQETGAEVRLLHVLPVVQEGLLAGSGYPFSLPDLDREIEVAQEELNRLASVLPGGVRVTTHVASGHNVAEQIVSCAKDEKVDLIAHSTHGRTGLRRLVLGSVAENVLRRARVPVLSFPPPQADRETPRGAPKRVLMTTDLSEASLTPLHTLSNWEDLDAVQLLVLHVVAELIAIPHGSPMAPPMPPPDVGERIARAKTALEGMCAGWPQLEGATQTVLANQDTAQACANFAAANEVDWIALSTHGNTGWRKLVFGSVASAILRYSTVPVLSVPRKR